MVIVVIVGILSAVGVASFRRQVNSSKATEAFSTIRAIAAAQERYRSENLQYLDVSQGNLTNHYPMTGEPGDTKYHWVQPTHADWEPEGRGGWKLLGVNAPGPVQHAYSVVAGGPTDPLPSPATTATINWGTQINDPWYVIQARGNIDGESSVYVAASFRGEVYSE